MIIKNEKKYENPFFGTPCTKTRIIDPLQTIWLLKKWPKGIADRETDRLTDLRTN